jgi:hypothetical protein
MPQSLPSKLGKKGGSKMLLKTQWRNYESSLKPGLLAMDCPSQRISLLLLINAMVQIPTKGVEWSNREECVSEFKSIRKPHRR